MWDEDGYASRWIQGICAIFLAIFAVGGAYMALHSAFFMFKFGGFAVFIGAIRLCWRCARYAITGSGNVNRDYLRRQGTICRYLEEKARPNTSHQKRSRISVW